MTELTRNIHSSIFGEIPTSELLSIAFEKKKNYFGNTITYSPKVFIPLTTMCRDSCAYCTFVKSPKEGGTYLNEEEVITIASAGNEAGCYEALFTLGDKPELKWDYALNQLNKLGFSSTHEYLIHSMKQVNQNFNLFPHANPGLMSLDEIKDLKQHSPSGGVMIETFSKNIYEKGSAHYKTESKYIDLRLETLNNAYEVKYPVTTGLLLGLTTTKEEIVDDISNLISLMSKNSAIQEVILQNFRAKKNTLMKNSSEITNDLFLRIIATTRIHAPSHISIQVPPNLSPDINIFLKSGINDLGGISPLTIDWVNPDHLWPNINKLQSDISNSDQVMKKRLPVYPEFIKKEWLSRKIFEKANNIIDTDGYPKDNNE
jgi:FO synthase